jgi:hypothetical protein
MSCQKDGTGYQVNFVEQEPGIDPYATRVIVNANYLRMDEGESSVQYLIYDRKQRIIHNVNTEDKTVMQIPAKTNELQPPFPLTHEIKDLGVMTDAPKINNTIPHHRQHLTNNEICMNVISVDGLLPQVVNGLVELQNTLADDSASTFYLLPADLHKPCEISRSIFSPVRHLRHGFPIKEWRADGYSRSLYDYKENIATPASLFVVPKEYFHFTAQQMRDGVVDVNKREIIESPAVPAPTP